MAFPKQIKDIVYKLLQEPTLDNFREFLKNQTGEHNPIDFKREWINGGKLAKEMLSLANFGGGIIVFGVKENDDKTYSCDGLTEILDKSKISNEVKSFISSNLKYEIYDFTYTSSEYRALENKMFQMMVVEDTPEFLPFFSKKEGDSIKANMIYIRRGTSCEIADESEVGNLINRRINHIYPVNGQPLDLKEHLNQLQILFENIKEKKQVFHGQSGFFAAVKNIISGFGQYEEIPNPLYPEEGFEDFVLRMITEKKKKIERLLDLR